MFLRKFANLAPRKRLGIIAIFLGILAVFADDPYDKGKTMINTKELSLISVDNITKIKAEDLADAIIKSKFDYRLIDLRKPQDFAEYHIPSAENIQVDQILNSDLARNTKIILYSDNDIESTQAWFLLKSKNYKGVNILEGGLKNWKDNILFPTYVLGDNPTKEQLHKFDKLSEVSKFFGGKIQTSKNLNEEPHTALPSLTLPSKVILKKASGKPKREGC